LAALRCRRATSADPAGATELCAEGLQTRFAKVLEYLPDEMRLMVRAGVGWAPTVRKARTSGSTCLFSQTSIIQLGRNTLLINWVKRNSKGTLFSGSEQF
jgi:hypothetical protein